VICTNLTRVEVQKVSREIPRRCFVNVGFPVAREGLVHWHTGANFAGKHCSGRSALAKDYCTRREKCKDAGANVLSSMRQKSLGIRSPR